MQVSYCLLIVEIYSHRFFNLKVRLHTSCCSYPRPTTIHTQHTYMRRTDYPLDIRTLLLYCTLTSWFQKSNYNTPRIWSAYDVWINQFKCRTNVSTFIHVKWSLIMVNYLNTVKKFRFRLKILSLNSRLYCTTDWGLRQLEYFTVPFMSHHRSTEQSITRMSLFA